MSAELIAVISVSGSVLATLITTIFTSMSLSRCKNIVVVMIVFYVIEKLLRMK